MAKVWKLFVGIITALTLCKYSQAEWNVTLNSANRTVSSCHRHGNGDNCTVDTDPWNGHFSKCPVKFKNYCVHGDCRYVEEQKVPSCRCQHGYTGSRCEYLDLDWLRGEKRDIIIFCVIAALILLILLIIFICTYSHRRCRCRRRGRRLEEASNGTEKLSMMDTGASRRPLPADVTEPLHTSVV